MILLHSKLILKKEEELLLCCAGMNIGPKVKSKITSLVSYKLDWAYILEIARIHKLKPLLYWQLNQICPAKIPKEVMLSLKENFNYNVKKNLLMLRELMSIYKFLRSKGLSPIPYKGPILAIDIYGNIALREFGDLDIFINKSDLINVLEQLNSLEYVPKFFIEQNKLEKYIKTQRDMQFVNKEKNILLEIHWNFKNLFFSLSQELWDGKESINIKISDIDVLNPTYEDMFLILCLHNANHRWSRLLWLCDIVELIKSKKLNWEVIFTKAENLGIKRIVSLNLYLAKDLLNLNLPEYILSKLENKSSLMILNKIESSVFNTDFSRTLMNELQVSFFIRENKINGFRDVIRGLTNPTIYEWKNLPLPAYLWRIYHIYRVFNLLLRHDWK